MGLDSLLSYETGDRCGDLVLGKCVGQGGMAKVFLAENPATGSRYAVKVMLGLSAEGTLRFRREGQAQAAAAAHRNVLQVHDLVEDPRGPYLVLEYASGGDLQQRLEQDPLAPNAARSANSALRAESRTRSRLATFAQAISSTSPVMPIRSQIPRETSPRSAS